ncbi:MAG: diaminopimelate epimerase [Nitrospira sp.]|nr:diaminopimelate epimerase [Nitrospira sp.]
MHFTKMHGLGNDFILINCIDEVCPSDLETFSRRLCDRRFGIGADQLLLLYPSDKADFKMRILNADGSEVEMCGNGIRCLAKYIWDRNLSDKDILNIETIAGIIRPEKAGDLVRVDMGEPIFEPERIPVKIQQPEISGRQSAEKLSTLNSQLSTLVIDYPLQIADKEFKITCVSMGNPHAVIVVDDVSHFPVTYYGPMIETHSFFPKRINVEFIEVQDNKNIKIRVWERGSGETMACGTGASAVGVASNVKKLTDKNVTVHLLGGDLLIEWAENNHVYMTGAAVEVFEGIIAN